MQRAIILAAGVGKRLGKLTKEIPKCLLPIDSDNVLLDFSLETLKENRIKEIIFVSGFAHEKLKQHTHKKWTSKFSFKFIFNEKYNEYNNVYSAYLARNFWDDETILLNSDIIFHPAILSNLKLKIKNQKSYLIIDDRKKLTEEDMKVIVNEKGEIKKINKHLSIKESLGEYIGIIYLRGLERAKFLESLEENVKNKNFDLYYEDALGCILDQISIYPCSTEGNLWTEVDIKEDYEVAKNIVYELNKYPLQTTNS